MLSKMKPKRMNCSMGNRKLDYCPLSNLEIDGLRKLEVKFEWVNY